MLLGLARAPAPKHHSTRNPWTNLLARQGVEIRPREEVRRVGGQLNVLCKVNYPIDSCRMTVGNTPYRLIPSQQDGDVVYAGQGLQFGECGATIKNIKEEWNGNITCVLPPQSGAIEVQASMHLIVARPPLAPQLLMPPVAPAGFVAGDELRAQCIVAGGRPAAKITWFLDEEQLLTGLHQPILTTDGDLQTVSQNLSLPLTPEEAGKVLACRAEHEALDQPREAKRQLVVNFPPQRQEPGTITIFGLKLGSEGRLNVTVRASPPPRVEWRVGDAVLHPRQVSDGEVMMALEPIPLGRNYYNLTLLVPHLSKEDVDHKYYLRASNEFGDEDFTVLISTMDEPAGVELEAGAIVGIVIAVLVAVAAISLVVFAKATDRWCFAGGRGRDHAKASGESTPAGDVLLESGLALPSGPSDTESAVGGGGARSRLADLSARVRAALPRAKDKVQATEARAADTEDKPLSEEKKSVVYAELQLGEQTAEKPPPPSTEYAEIVYTDQTKEAKE